MLRAVSHAVRCMAQIPLDDLGTWRRDLKMFRSRIYDAYSDELDWIPPEFEAWTTEGDVSSRPTEKEITDLLDRLVTGIQSERRA